MTMYTDMQSNLDHILTMETKKIIFLKPYLAVVWPLVEYGNTMCGLTCIGEFGD